MMPREASSSKEGSHLAPLAQIPSLTLNPMVPPDQRDSLRAVQATTGAVVTDEVDAASIRMGWDSALVSPSPTQDTGTGTDIPPGEVSAPSVVLEALITGGVEATIAEAVAMGLAVAQTQAMAMGPSPKNQKALKSQLSSKPSRQTSALPSSNSSRTTPRPRDKWISRLPSI